MGSTFSLQALLPFSLIVLTLFLDIILHHLFYCLLYLTVVPAQHPSFIFPFFMQLLHLSSMLPTWLLILPSPVTKSPIFALQFCALFPTASSTPLSSIFPFSLCMSWHHRCVPNVPHTLFSSIKLLSLLSPAAARITWAEGALFKYRAAPGRKKPGVWRKGREGRERKKRKCRKKMWNKMNWED